MFGRQDREGDPFFIAEVGQNHNGSLELARQYVDVFARKGASAIKFQTRKNDYLFSPDAYRVSYDSENAFADTYGMHREALELKPEWLRILKKDCESRGVKFMSTPFDEPSLELLIDLGVDILKVASFDVGNLPFINRISRAGKPVAISIGGGLFDQIRSSVEVLESNMTDFVILHCVSEYPCPAERMGLDNLLRLREFFPNHCLGLSDHFSGTLSGPLGYMQGARVFEKHVTLNRASKGTDHSFSLEPEGFRKFVRDIKRVPKMLKPKAVEDIGNEPVFKKLGKSIVAIEDIPLGACLTLDNLSGKIFREQIIPVREFNKVLGKRASVNIFKGEAVTFDMLMD